MEKALLEAQEFKKRERGDDDWRPIQVPVKESLAILRSRWRWISLWITVGALISIIISLLIPNEYTSTASIMPPDQQTFANSSMLGVLSGGGLLGAGLSGGGLLSQRTPGQTAIGVLGSRTVQDDMIQRFNLRSVYNVKYAYLARKRLAKKSSFLEDKKSGIITITVVDRDPKRSRDMAAAYVDELEKLTNDLSTSSARRERIFLEEHLKKIKGDLDSSTLSLSQFSSKNATMDIQKQGQATVEAAARLQGELMAAETRLSALQISYTSESPQVKTQQAQISELANQLRRLSGSGVDSDVSLSKPDELMPSLRKLPLLGPTYYDLYRRVTILDTVYAILNRQYELAKVQEAKEIPPVKMLDLPDIPERKSAPHRSLIVLGGVLLSLIAAGGWLLIAEYRSGRLNFPTST